MMVLLQRTCLRHSIVLWLALILNCYFLQNRLKYWQQLDSRFLNQSELQIANNTDFCEWFLLNEFFGVVSAHVFSVVDQEVRDDNSLVGVAGCFPMLMNLTVQGTHLHVRFALVLQ